MTDELFSIYDLRPPESDPRQVIQQPGVVIDGCAGAGGWCEGLLAAGFTGPSVGIELDQTACATAEAAGHMRIHADVATFPIGDVAGPVEGLTFSPPCPGFSVASGGIGRGDLPTVRRLVDDYAAGHGRFAHHWDDYRSPLTAEPMRWGATLRPRWIAFEQVPAVLPVWEHIAVNLQALGYATWAGVLDAADYGVPQNRKRAYLLAVRDLDHVGPPEATHHGRWVTMADALGWAQSDVVGFPRRADKGEQIDLGGELYRARDLREADRPAQAVTEKIRSWERWPHDRPATTVQGDPRIWPPGHKVNQSGRDRLGVEEAERRYGDRAGTRALRVSLDEAAVLQGFRRGYPWQGPMSHRFLQVGNAVAPPMAAALLRQVITASGAEAAP